MKVAIIDDCKTDQITISHCITQYFTHEPTDGPPSIRCFDSGEAFLSAFGAGQFDLILLDCCMAGMNGLETALEIRKLDKRCALVFITVSTDYAVDGYLVSASGYLVKPFTEQSFAQAIQVALSGSADQRTYVTLPHGPHPARLLLKDIVFCDIDGHYIQVHQRNGAILRVRMTFRALCDLLASHPQFMEAFRGCIVNMAHIQKVEELNFLMVSGERVPFRKKERKKLLQQYSDYLFDNTDLKQLG